MLSKSSVRMLRGATPANRQRSRDGILKVAHCRLRRIIRLSLRKSEKSRNGSLLEDNSLEGTWAITSAAALSATRPRTLDQHIESREDSSPSTRKRRERTECTGHSGQHPASCLLLSLGEKRGSTARPSSSSPTRRSLPTR